MILDGLLLRRFVWAFGLSGAGLFLVHWTLGVVELFNRLSARRPVTMPEVLWVESFRTFQALEICLELALIFGSVGMVLSLQRHQELYSLQAAGMPRWRLCMPVLAFVFVLGLGHAAWLSPFAAEQKRLYRLVFSGQPVAVARAIQGPIRFRITSERAHHFFLAARYRADQRDLQSIRLVSYHADTGHLVRLVTAVRGEVTEDGSVHLFEGSIWEETGPGRPYSQYTGAFSLPSPDTLRLQVTPVASMAGRELVSAIRQLRANGFEARDHVIRLLELLTRPWFHGLLVLVTLGPLMGLVPRGSSLKLVFYGGGQGVGLYFADDFFRAAATARFGEPWFASLMPLLLGLILAWRSFMLAHPPGRGPGKNPGKDSVPAPRPSSPGISPR